MRFEIATRCVAASTGQDRVFARGFQDVAIVALADGAGGRAGGGEAAQIVVQEAAKFAQSVRNPRDAKFWAHWLREIDILIRDDERAGETTAVIAAIGADFVVGASVGDSSIWLVDEKTSLDLSERQTRKPFLGIGGASPMAFSARLCGQTVLLGSDGLFKYAVTEVIAKITRGTAIEKSADELIECVRYPSGALPDDFSCVLCRAL